MKTILYGIPNCDTVKKARRWLADNNVDYTFHDYKKSGIDQKRIKIWLKDADLDALINRRGTTWRKLPEADRENLTEASAIKLMIANPSLIKRPVLEAGDSLQVGFDADIYREILG